MSYYRIDYEFYICNHILYENCVSLSVQRLRGIKFKKYDRRRG